MIVSPASASRCLFELAVEFDPLLRLVEQIEDLVPLELADAGQVAMRKGLPARGIAAGGGA